MGERRALLPLHLPREYALGNKLDHPPNVYLREDAILRRVDR
ncbi:hypothetical protein ACQP1K_27685 [Sphaerimonospora sp. CA-214678]